MFNNVALDVFIGLIAIFLLYSLLASILMEVVAKRFGLRARMTRKAISNLLDDRDFTDENFLKRGMKSMRETQLINGFKGCPLTALFYAHPNIKNLGKNNLNRMPSDISPELFSETVIQLLRGDKFNGQQSQIDLINTNLQINSASEGKIELPDWYTGNYQKLWEKEIKNVPTVPEIMAINKLTLYQLKQFLYDSHSDITLFNTKLIHRYNEIMERATGWYIKQTRIILFIIGFILALGFNIDTIAITTKLSKDKTARDKMIEFAGKLQDKSLFDNISNKNSPSMEAAISKAFVEAGKSITESNHIIGNTLSSDNINDYSFFGWLITAFAISLGAPFWFDLLKKIMSVRQAGGSSAENTTNETQNKNSVSPKDRIG